MEEIETGAESTSEESTGGASDTSSSESGGETAQAAAPKQEQEIDWSKAFEHPRFKELVGQKNEAQSRYQEIESRYKALEQQLTSLKDSQPKAPTETDALLADLKKVDPRLANVISEQLKAAETAKAVQARLEQFEKQSQENAQQATIQAAVAKINGWHEANKVSPEMRQMLNDKFDLLYFQGKLTPQNLEQTYKETHASFKKYEDTLSRTIRESYVKDKTKDSNVPTSVPKGAQAKPTPKAPPTFKSKDDLRQAVVKSFIKEQAAAKAADAS